MLIPLWFAGIIAAAFVAQLLGGIAWIIRSDKARAVSEERMQGVLTRLTEKVDQLTATLEKHNPVEVKGQIEAIVQRVSSLEESKRAQLEKYNPVEVKGQIEAIIQRVSSLEESKRAHHKLIRGLQRRMDRSHLPEEPSDADGDS